MKHRLLLLLIFITVYGQTDLYAQQKFALNTWIDYLPYKNVKALTQSDDKVYTATDISLYSVDKNDYSIERISKCTGLHDLGFSDILYDTKRNQLIIAYSNSNIDLYKNGSVINLPDLKIKNIPGNKNINSIYIRENYAYLSCGFGIVVLDLDNVNFYDTYYIGTAGNALNVNEMVADNNYLYAATDSGLLRAEINNPFLSNFNSWSKIGQADGLPLKKCQHVITDSDIVYASFDSIVYSNDSGTWDVLIQKNGSYSINNMYISDNKLYTCFVSYTSPIELNILDLETKKDTMVDRRYFLGYPEEVLKDKQGRIWIADLYNSLSYGNGFEQSIVYPNSPANSGVWQIDANNGRIFVAPGGLNGDGGFAYNRSGFFTYTNDYWLSFDQNNNGIIKDSSIMDIISVAYNPVNGYVYFTSFDMGGLLELGDSLHVFRKGFIQRDPSFENYPTYSCAVDPNGNVWVTNPTTAKPLIVKTIDNKWYSFALQEITNTGLVGKVYTDRYNQVWVIISGDGILVYNHGDDISTTSDDKFKRIVSGVGLGNLPDLTVNDMVLDNNDEMWLGTNTGIAVIYCPFDLFSSGCDAQQIIVEGLDSIAGYLLEMERVTSIAIDAANRKWVGTENGVWLFSEDGTKQIYHFTTDNSPLFSNTITDVKVDNETGLVYIATDKGLMAFQGDATTPATGTKCDMLIYPNPVKHDYSGPIAFRNLPYNSTLKISDTEGKLVFQTTSNGGTATWNGLNYNGQRAHTGVYYATVSGVNSDSQQTTCTGTLLFIK